MENKKNLRKAVSEAMNSVHGFPYGMKIPLHYDEENDS